jgi:hypothetical protein
MRKVFLAQGKKKLDYPGLDVLDGYNKKITIYFNFI